MSDSTDRGSSTGPIAVLDVHYSDQVARAACVVAERWDAAEPIELRTSVNREVPEYVPGRFFERELPPLLRVLAEVTTPLEVLVVDSYVVLDEAGTPGLGGHLYSHLDGRYVVVGVAKTRYRGSDFATPVLRGQSRRPLFVTALGMDPAVAADHVCRMHGANRIPTLLREADRRARGR